MPDGLFRALLPSVIKEEHSENHHESKSVLAPTLAAASRQPRRHLSVAEPARDVIMPATRDHSFRQMVRSAVVKIKILSTMNEMALQLQLKKAVESNDLVAAKDVISRGAWVNARSPAGSTYLMEASRLGYISIVKLLIKNKATVNAVNFQNNTALHYAYQKQQYAVIQYLESHGASPSHKILNQKGLTPRKFMYAKLPLDRKLKVACQHGDLQNAEFFLLQGADVNFKTMAGSTPLMDAVWFGHSHVVDFLLRSGADIEHKVRSSEFVCSLEKAV